MNSISISRLSGVIYLAALALKLIHDACIAHSLRGQIATESSERLICVKFEQLLMGYVAMHNA